MSDVPPPPSEQPPQYPPPGPAAPPPAPPQQYPPPGPGAPPPPGYGAVTPPPPNQQWGAPNQGGYAAPMPGQYNSPPPVPPKKGMSGCLIAFLIVFGILVVSGIGMVACTAFVIEDAAEEIVENTGVADEDDFTIEVEECVNEEFAGPTARGTFTNDSGERQGFHIDVEFFSDGVRVASGFTILATLDPGASTTWSASPIDVVPEVSDLECETTVNYTLFDDQTVDLFD